MYIYVKRNFPVPQLMCTLRPALPSCVRATPSPPRGAGLACSSRCAQGRRKTPLRCHISEAVRAEAAGKRRDRWPRDTAAHRRGSGPGPERALTVARASLTKSAAYRGPKAQPVSLPGASGCKGASKSTGSGGFPALPAAHQEGKGEICPCCRAPRSTLPPHAPTRQCRFHSAPYCQLLPLA